MKDREREERRKRERERERKATAAERVLPEREHTAKKKTPSELVSTKSVFVCRREGKKKTQTVLKPSQCPRTMKC